MCSKSNRSPSQYDTLDENDLFEDYLYDIDEWDRYTAITPDEMISDQHESKGSHSAI